MTQRNVQNLIGRLVLEEELRGRFLADPGRTLAALVREGLDLTGVEIDALASLHPRALERFARAVDERLQMASLAHPTSAGNGRQRNQS